MLGPSDSAITLSQINREIYYKKLCMLIIQKYCFIILLLPHDFCTDHFFLFAFLMTDTIYEAVIINN